MRLVFSSDRAKADTFNMYWVNANGTGEVTGLVESNDTQVAGSWHPSGEFLAFHNVHGNDQDLMILPMHRDENGR